MTTQHSGATLLIRAPREKVFAIAADVAALASCLRPEGATARVLGCDRTAQVARMQITHGPGPAGTRRFRLERLEAEPVARVVYGAAFETDDPSLAGEMALEFSLTEEAGGTRVTVRCEGLPRGIRPEDNARGTLSSLRNLARLAEERQSPRGRGATAMTLFHFGAALFMAALAAVHWRGYGSGAGMYVPARRTGGAPAGWSVGPEDARAQAAGEALAAVLFAAFGVRAARRL